MMCNGDAILQPSSHVLKAIPEKGDVLGTSESPYRIARPAAGRMVQAYTTALVASHMLLCNEKTEVLLPQTANSEMHAYARFLSSSCVHIQRQQ